MLSWQSYFEEKNYLQPLGVDVSIIVYLNMYHVKYYSTKITNDFLDL